MSDGMSDAYRQSERLQDARRREEEWVRTNPERARMREELREMLRDGAILAGDVANRPLKDLELAMWKAHDLSRKFAQIAEDLRMLRAGDPTDESTKDE